jgi:Helix-hairpin-helix domain
MTDPNADVIKGYEFCATLQLRTPLRVLQHHGEVQQWSENGLPTYAHFLWEGIWLPITKTWAELAGSNAKLRPADSSADHAFDDIFRKKLIEHGFSPEEAATVLPNAMASDIGPIPQDGGTYLGFLRAFRGIVEFSASPDEKREAIETLSRDHPDYAKYISIHRARSSNWPDEWLGYQEWLQVPGIGTRIARRLYDAGFRSRAALRQASDADLAAIKGVGKATIFRIKHAML